MSAPRTVSVLFLALGAIIAATSAGAQDGGAPVPSRNGRIACVWNHLPGAMQKDLVDDSLEQTGLAPVLLARGTEYETANKSCGLNGTVPSAALIAYAGLRGLEADTANQIPGDTIERAFLTLSDDVRDAMTDYVLRADFGTTTYTPGAEVARVTLHQAAHWPGNHASIDLYGEGVAKVLFYEAHMVLGGPNVAGATACVYAALPPEVRREAYNAAGEEELVYPVFQAHADDLAAAAAICDLEDINAFAVGEETKVIFLTKQVPLPRDKPWSDIDRAVAGLPEADRTHLKTVFSTVDKAVTADDIAFVDRMVFQVIRDAGLGHPTPDSPVPDYVRRYMAARAHVDAYEGVS